MNLSEVYKGDLVSRFFRTSDERVDTLASIPLPIPWWSRRYEYPWAATFAHPVQRVLDAACGISHPFKLHLFKQCAEVYACDLDGRILDVDAIVRDVIADFGSGVDVEDIRWCLNKTDRRQANITSLPYDDNIFDRVFCISVLEHMTREDMLKALKEFKRVLKPEGLVVLTFDVPTISTALFVNIVQASGLWFAGEFDPQRFKDIVSTNMYGGLSCFRAVLK